MKVTMFQERFAEAVTAGTKRQTIRPISKRPPRVGEARSLRQWSGKPYRSPQVTLRNVTITRIDIITITNNGACINSRPLQAQELELLAKNDGFPDWPTMLAWFRTTHTLPFTGNIIHW